MLVRGGMCRPDLDRSCEVAGLVHPESVDLLSDGVHGDRRFWLVDGDGRLFNNKRNGPMMTIQPKWDEATRQLSLSFPNGTQVAGPVEIGEPVVVELYGRPHPSRRVIGPWQDAISRSVGRPLTLLWSEDHATDRGRVGGTVSLVSRGSLERLREKAGVEAPIDGRRFRMMFEIDGVPAHAEDEWIGSSLRLGDAALPSRGLAGRGRRPPATSCGISAGWAVAQSGDGSRSGAR